MKSPFSSSLIVHPSYLMLDWLLQEGADISLPPEMWLAPAEQEKLAGLQVAKRRGDWLLGRWTAKRLLQSVEQKRSGVVWPLAQLAIAPRADGSPELVSPRLPWALSLSHSHGRALAAVLPGDPDQAIGADLEKIALRPPSFNNDYFTPLEQAWLAELPADQKALGQTIIWSGKEAFLKAIKKGLTLSTQTVSCLPSAMLRGDIGWQSLQVVSAWETRPWSGWWRTADDFVLTLVHPQNPIPET
jgi:4'-phosphopantetheinyl transferase